MGETPFYLTYGIDVVLPVELCLATYGVLNFDEDQNDKIQREKLDFLDEQTVVAYMAKQWAHIRFNARVVSRRFAVGDLVLHRACNVRIFGISTLIIF